MTFRDYWQSNSSAENPPARAILFDVDGTVVSGRYALPGVENTLDYLRKNNVPFLFLTNDSHHSAEQKAALIGRSGIKVSADEIVSCSHVLAEVVEKYDYYGAKVFIMGEFGTPCYAESAGLEPCRDLDKIDECEFVIAGEGYFDWHDTFQAVLNYFIRHRDRLLVVPNPDSCWPYSNTGKLGIGAGAQARFIAGLLKEMSIDIEVVYLGKPHPMIYGYAAKRLRKKFGLPDLALPEIMMIGDSLTSDIAGAVKLGMKNALVMTGVTTREMLDKLPPEQLPKLIFDTLDR